MPHRGARWRPSGSAPCHNWGNPTVCCPRDQTFQNGACVPLACHCGWRVVIPQSVNRFRQTANPERSHRRGSVPDICPAIGTTSPSSTTTVVRPWCRTTCEGCAQSGGCGIPNCHRAQVGGPQKDIIGEMERYGRPHPARAASAAAPGDQRGFGGRLRIHGAPILGHNRFDPAHPLGLTLLLAILALGVTGGLRPRSVLLGFDTCAKPTRAVTSMNL